MPSTRACELSDLIFAVSLSVELYLSPIETHCSNIDYFPSIENGSETEESTRLHLARGVIALFILSFFSVICAFFTGLSGELRPRQAKVA
jgi:PMP-22/EMP/MP20/Claudin tight junction